MAGKPVTLRLSQFLSTYLELVDGRESLTLRPLPYLGISLGLLDDRGFLDLVPSAVSLDGGSFLESAPSAITPHLYTF